MPSSRLRRPRPRERRRPVADLDLARKVLETEAAAILALIPRIDSRFDQAVESPRACRGRVILTGMGKLGIISRKIAATLTSTGTAALFLDPARGGAWRPRRHPGRRSGAGVVERRDRGSAPTARDHPACRGEADRDRGRWPLHSGRSRRHLAGLQRDRGSLPAQSVRPRRPRPPSPSAMRSP